MTSASGVTLDHTKLDASQSLSVARPVIPLAAC